MTLPCAIQYPRRHHDNNVLFAGKGSPTQPVGQRHAINYWSLYDNKILRKFRGHTDKIISISMCPADDTLLSSSADRTVRLWNISQAGCLAEMKLPDETEKSPLAAFDTTGLVFAVTAALRGGAGHCVHLYDARNYGAGAFAELKVNQEDIENVLRSQAGLAADRASLLSKVEWTSIEFNLSGNQILVGAEKGMSMILDGFEGTVQRVLVGKSDRPAVSCITPDDKTLLQGNDDGTISCWSIESGSVVKTLEGHPASINCVAANPKYAQIASCCTQTALWTW